MDNGADTSVIGHGWYIQMIDQFRRMNIIGFDSERSKKTGLRVVVAVTALDLPNGELVLLRISEAAYNPNSQHSLLSEFQLQEKGCKIDSKARSHGGLQCFWPSGSDKPMIPLTLGGALIHFKHRYPTSDEVVNCTPIDITDCSVP